MTRSLSLERHHLKIEKEKVFNTQLKGIEVGKTRMSL
jgi:hypothetical protein